MIRNLVAIKDFPPIIIWYTEQIPDPRTPTWFSLLNAKLRVQVESWYDKKIGYRSQEKRGHSWLPGLERYRRVGELLALHSIGCIKLICAFSETQTRYLSQLGLPVTEIPLGIHSQFGRLMDIPRDVDVVFLGTTQDMRRRKWIPYIEEKLAKFNVKMVIKDGSQERGTSYDEDRTMLLNRSKIMINVMKRSWDDPIFRLLLSCANGAMLLSEKIWQTSLGGFDPKQHFAESVLDRLPDTVLSYLGNETARQKIVNQASEKINQEYTMEIMVGRLVNRLSSTDFRPC